MNGWPSLLADAEMFKIILVVVAGLIALVKHFVDANGKAQARRPVVKPEVRPRVKPPPAAARPAMPGDVNEFLRRAAEKRAAAQRAPASESAAAPRRLVTSPLDASDEVVHAQAVDEVHSANRVGAHVQQHLGMREFDERLAHLTHVDRSEAAFQAHLQQTFQHHVGQLEAQASESPAPAPEALTADAPWAALLAVPGNIHQAIVLNEILQRPLDRWQ